MRVWIAEKPSVAKAIVAAIEPSAPKTRTHFTLSNGDVVTWCFGHMLEQAPPDHYLGTEAWSLDPLPVIPDKWVYFPRDSAEAQLKAIAGFLKQATEIVHAGDPDAEGQRIVDSITEFYGIRKPTRRLLITDVNVPEVKAAIKAMRPNTDPEFRGWSASAEARSCIDWLLGMNLTRAATLKGREAGYQGVMPVGRVKAPVVGIVVKRDLAIENFKPAPYFTLNAPCLTAGGSRFRARWKPNGDVPNAEADGRIHDRGLAEQIARELAGGQGVVESFTEKAVAQNPPLLFSLNRLLQAMNKAHGHSAKAASDAMQSLYEAGHLTYPRTSYEHASMARHAEGGDRLKSLAAVNPALAAIAAKANPSLKSPAFDDAKIGSKHAIIPTAAVPNLADLSPAERDVYLAVATRFAIQFLPPLRYMQLNVVVRAGQHRLFASGRRIIDPGFTAAIAPEAKEEGEGDDENQTLPAITQGETVRIEPFSPASAMTRPPQRFTEAGLLAAMEKAHEFVEDPALRARLREGDGIGTEATREGTITELIKSGLLERQKNNIVSSRAARGLVAFLPPIITDPALTAILDQGLDRVAALEVPAAEFVTKHVALVQKLVGALKGTAIKVERDPALTCPACKEGQLRRLKGAKGFFWGCSRFRDGCKHTVPDNKGKPGVNLPPGASAPKKSKPSTSSKTTTRRNTKP